MEEDQRFAHITTDPKFRRIPKTERKVKIDKRFKSMFKDERFKVKYTTDKRGRPVNYTSNEDLKRYYELSSGESSSDSEDETSPPTKTEDSDLKSGQQSTKKVQKRLKNLNVDYARGESTLLSESSSDDEDDSSDDNASEAEELDHAWGELDKDASHTEEITSRLAACNMDWDRIRATDLMVLLSSFLSTGSLITSVKIYPSEFGLQRMKEEEIKGPTELVESKPEDDDDKEGAKYHMEKLRRYQLNRLKYYYAVVVCDNKNTANKIYTECDGLEYESSATKMDLRFIPDDMEFEHEPKEVCDTLPEPGKYQPRFFTTTALQQAKVDLTWDETNPDRIEMTQRLAKGNADEITDGDLQAYLASSSEEEENEEPTNKEVKSDDEHEKLNSIDKYKALLQNIENETKSKNNDMEMEISWGIDLKEKTDKIIKQKKDDKERKTPFQQYLDKRKEKQKNKREERKKNHESDSDIPSDVDMTDPYFAEEFKKVEKKKRKEETSEDDSQKKAELELLLMNTDDAKNHFSLDKILETESKSKKKLKNKKKEVKLEIQDDFEVNVGDKRFSALYSSHHFNVDPTDSHYKKTKGMDAIVTEKLKRRAEQNAFTDNKKVKNDTVKKSAELNMLVKSVKLKTAALSDKKRKR